MTTSITAFFLSVSIELQIGLLALFSYTEGLPIVGSVLPGGTIAVLAGTLSAEGALASWVAALVVGMASFLGDMTGFFLGRKITHWKFVQALVVDTKYKRSWDLFDRHLAIVTIFGKLLPVVRSTPSLFAAIRKVRTRRYMLYSLIGSFLWGFVGVYAGNAIAQIIGPQAVLWVGVVFVGSVVVVVIRHITKQYLKRRRTS